MSQRVSRRGVSKFLTAREAERLLDAMRTRRAWGAFLSGFLWHHFATLTFAYQPSVPVAIRRFGVFVRRLEQRAQERVHWFYVLERGAAGMFHVHSLLSGTNRLHAASVADAWSWGRADASDYDARRGAAYYVTKSVASDVVEYDIDPPPRPPLTNADHPSAPRIRPAVLDRPIKRTPGPTILEAS